MSGLLMRILLACLVVLPCSVVAQLTVIIDRLPAYTPTGDSIYLVGSFNDWKTGDENFRFQQRTDGTWQYDFLTPMPDFEFKVTRGDWETVEGGAVSEPIGNRKYLHTERQRDTLRLEILSWEDLREAIPFRDTLSLRIVSLPENTPVDATLYVVGSFNGWSPADPDFKMAKDEEGYFRITIPVRENVTEFKISRGNWSTIESRANGLARPNRIFNYEQDNPAELLQLEVANWEDLAGNGFNWYTMILLLAALQGIMLVIAINSLKERRRRTNRILSLLIIVLSLTFLARIGAFDRDIFQRFPKVMLLPDLVYFTYGPLFWLYLRSLTPNQPYRWRWFWHFLPLCLVMVVYLPQGLKSDFDFITQVVNLQLRPLFVGVAAAGLVFSIFYWIRSRRFLKRLNAAYAQEGLPILHFLRTVFYLHTLCLLLWMGTYVVGALGYWLGWEWTNVTDRITDAAWVVLAIGAYTMGYYAMRQPQIFRSHQLNLPVTEDPIPQPFLADSALTDALALTDTSVSTTLAEERATDTTAFQRVEAFMASAQPFLNPGLSLKELSDMVGLPSHQVSKLINDCYGSNFFDYVNSYRIRNFENRVEQGDHHERTILSLAIESGFNSKTAFNRAFKKQNGITPRQYLRTLTDS